MIQSIRLKTITNIIAWGLIIGGFIGLIIFLWFPVYYSNWYSAILVFFIILESINVLWIEKKSKSLTDMQLANIYLLSKTMKIILSLFLILIFSIIVKDKIEVRNFTISFILLYLTFLAIESVQFLKIEKELKMQKMKNQNGK